MTPGNVQGGKMWEKIDLSELVARQQGSNSVQCEELDRKERTTKVKLVDPIGKMLKIGTNGQVISETRGNKLLLS